MSFTDVPGARFRARRTAIAVTVAVTALGMLTAASAARPSRSRGCRGADTPVTRASAATVRRTIVCLLNGERARHGLLSLRERRSLDRAAQRWTNTMAATGRFAHSRFFAARIAGFGYRWSAVGENIATGFASPRAVVRGWMRSRDHCVNILTSAFTDVGTGLSRRVARGAATGTGTWTLDFGLARGHRASHRGASAAGRCPYAG